ncbi:MAG: DUF4139 domain-containing protein [Planctomycetota bacterium]
MKHLTEKELIEYQFKLASDAQMKEATEHIEGCADCRGNLEKLQRKYAALDLLGEKTEISEDLISRVTEQASKPVLKKITWFKRPVWMSSVAAVLIVGLVLVATQLNDDRIKQREIAKQPMPTADKMELRSSQSIAPTQEIEVASKPERTPTEALHKGVSRKATLAMEPLKEAADKKEAADMYTVMDKAADDAVSEQPPFAPASAIELVTLPRRDKVQLTIYNSAFRTSISDYEGHGGFGRMIESRNGGGMGVGYIGGNPGVVVDDQDGQIISRPGGLIMVIQATIEPDSWFDLSDTGEGTIQIYDNTKLIVRQTREIHQKIEKLLQALKGIPGEQLKSESSIALDKNRTEPLVYKQIDQIVNLSDLKAKMSFGEVIEKLETSVRPPIQIQPNWKDLIENAEVEPTTPARMGPLGGIKLRKALEILLTNVTSAQLGEFGELTYVVDEGVILIGTVDMLPPKMETQVYDISGLDSGVGVTTGSDTVVIEENKVQDMRPHFVPRRPVTTSPNSLTLVRERRNLTMKKGWNWLQFMWANTLIDPTSLSLEALEQEDKIDIQQLVFPARLRELGRWLIHSEVSGQVPFEITYFTSGISWRAFYMGTLAEDEKTMQLQGYVRVANNSGEDYEEAQTRLIVGNVHILDEIAELAKRQYPYKRPGIVSELDFIDCDIEGRMGGMMGGAMMGDMGGMGGGMYFNERLSRKEIRKEGLSEYFLYTIEGTETIPNQWGKRLLSFDVENIEVESLYKYDEQRWGNQTIRFVKFENDEEHNLGQTPIPNGDVKIYGKADSEGFLSYVGGTKIKYIPVDEEVELNLGPSRLVKVEPKLMDFKTDNYKFDRRGNVAGWDEIRNWKIEISNTRELPIEIEITRGFGTVYWTIQSDAAYEKYDATHARFEVNLESQTKHTIEYTVTTYHGTREDVVAKN